MSNLITSSGLFSGPQGTMSGLQMQATMIDSVSKGVKELPYTASVVLLDAFTCWSSF